MTHSPSDQKVRFLSSMANPKRFEILEILSKGEVAVNELAGIVGLSQSAMSQNLAVLRAADMVTTRRVVHTIFYSVTSPNVLAIMRVVDQVFGDCTG